MLDNIITEDNMRKFLEENDSELKILASEYEKKIDSVKSDD